VAGLLILAGAQAGDVADRSMYSGFLSPYMGSRSSKTSMGDYNKLVTPQVSRMKPGGALDALDAALEDFNPSKIVKEEEEKSVQKLTNDHSMPIGMSAIAVSLLTLAAMLGVRMRRGLQQATDTSIALAPAAADNILELKGQESSVRGQVGWSQQSSENSHPLTPCYGETVRVKFRIHPDGRIEETVSGIKGSDCVKVTEELNEKLGKVQSTKATDEMYEQKVEVEVEETVTESVFDQKFSEW
jgi:hypothetical protein